MDEFLTHIADPSQGSMLLGHIEMHSSYRRQPTPIVYGENQSHAKWSYEIGVTSQPFRPHLFGIVVDIKSSAKDLGDGVNEYPTIVLGYPNEQHDMVSGNYYNQLLSLREQMYKDVEETNLSSCDIRTWTPLDSDTIDLQLSDRCVVAGLQSDFQSEPAKRFALASTVLSKGWHPGYIQVGAFIEAVVELRRIDNLMKTPLTMYYNVIAHQITVHAHDVDFTSLPSGMHI
ncbi:hypothetical protein C8J55DRAFT_554929 [Lentinula edodes]|uniref:Uncharacterized protein n=1 Tax=Lentinula lateritia TaxID=40482 RepID=A0A9W9AZ80_9AGAR|nr:hypothetical protein C8J55DRAFT_554929 [Lentinula edodes]